MLKDEFKYYIKHQDELVNKYNGKFIVIKNQEVIGDYESELEAIEETSKKEKLGTFLVQKCEPGNASFTQTFHSRVHFPTGQSTLSEKISAFTNSFAGLSALLQSQVTIGLAFNPDHSAPKPQTLFDAIWDTGATASAISERVVKKCGLKPTSITEVNTAGGLVYCDTYLVSIGLPNNVGFPEMRVTEAPLVGIDVLIGMDIILRGDLVVTNYQGKTVFSYRTPSASKIDFVQEINQSMKKSTGRNDPCPCGSGKKYKKCHGA